MRFASPLIVLAAMILCVESASAQLFQWTPGQLNWLDRIAETGMQAYYKKSLPTQGMRVMVTGTTTSLKRPVAGRRRAAASHRL
jgi:hypothetical protein